MTSEKGLHVGQEIRGFRLIERIGVGGFAEVYRAEQISLKRSVAVKTLHAEQRNIPEFEERFEAEAQIVARLDHPFIVPIIDYWYDEEKGAYIVMRWINGSTLNDKINQEPIPIAALLRYLDNITQAIDYAHRLGIIHRDIKPSNILLDTEDTAYLADFGIAQDIQELQSVDPASTIGGTLGFLAPELAFTHTVPQPRSDLYSLAIVVYMCLTGKHPFHLNELRHLNESMPDLPAGVANKAASDVLKRAASHDVEERYESVREFYEAFKTALMTQTPVLPPKAPPTKKHKPTAPPKTEVFPTMPATPATTKRAIMPVIGARTAFLIDHPDDVPERAEQFIARESHLEKMKDAIKNKRHVLLHGAGGMGKTTLAAEFASTLLDDDDIKAILWLHVGERSVQSLLEALMKPLDLDLSKLEEHAHRKAIREALESHDVQHIFLDDVWLDGRDLKRVMNTLPRDAFCICTSRSRYPVGIVFDVDQLAESDSLALLNFHAAQTDESDEAKSLCRVLGYHPLALEIAGKILLVDDIKPQVLQERLSGQIDTLAAPQRYSESHHESLQQVLGTSFQRLSHTCQQVFLAFGILSVPSATPEFLAKCLERDVDSVSDDLLTLQRRSLVKVEKAGDVLSYRVHEFAHSFTRRRHEIKTMAILPHVRDYVQEYSERLDILEADYLNILSYTDYAIRHAQATIGLDIVNSLVVKSRYALTRGYDAQLIDLLDKAIEIAEKSPEQNEVLHYLLGKRGDAARDNGKADKALDDYQKSLELARTLNLNDRQVVLMCVISRIHVDKKDFDIATQILRDAAVQANQLADDTLKSRVLENRGFLAQAIGDMKTAAEIFAEQLELALKVQDASRTFFAYLNYGAAKLFLEDFEAANSNLQHALDLAQRETNRIWEGYAHYAFGTMHHEKEARELAQASLEKALKCFEQSAAQALVEDVRTFMIDNQYQLPETQ